MAGEISIRKGAGMDQNARIAAREAAIAALKEQGLPSGGLGEEFNTNQVMPMVNGMYMGGNGPIPMLWEPALGNYPADMPRLLAWIYKSFAVFNHFGKIATVPITSNILSLPTAGLGVPPWDVGTVNGNACGAYFPRDFCWEAVFRGIYRIKLTFGVANLLVPPGPVPGTSADYLAVKQGLEDSMNLRLGQCGTINSYIVFLNMDASDCVRNQHCCNGDGFFLAPCEEFIPFHCAPESQSIEIQGTAPGQALWSYDLSINFKLYFKPIC